MSPITTKLMPATLLPLLLALCGCSADNPMNPAFPLRYAEAQEILHELEASPRKPVRPIVVAGGIHDPGFIAAELARDLRNVIHPESPLIHVSFFGTNTFDECAVRLIESIEEAFPSDHEDATVEVDVVGFSMGGLVARHAARLHQLDGNVAEDEADIDGDCVEPKRLRMARLFTISTPHRGANWAHLPTFDDRARDMRFGSSFIEALNESLDEASYELYCYVRLGDSVVGQDNAAPPGWPVLWVANRPLSMAHLGASGDARILADIARRLRDERAYAVFSADAPDPGSAESAATGSGEPGPEHDDQRPRTDARVICDTD